MKNSDAPIAADIRPTVEEIISLCRMDLEVLFNLQYLFMVDAHAPDKVVAYADLMSQHLERMEAILCAKLRSPGSA
jgi:hypothetical protein